MGRICQSRKGGVPRGVAPGYRHHLGPKDSTMVKETEKRWQKMHGKKGVRQYDTAAAAAFAGAHAESPGAVHRFVLRQPAPSLRFRQTNQSLEYNAMAAGRVHQTITGHALPA